VSRPMKLGLSYFPHDTDALSDEKLASLVALHGAEGYAFYFMMLEKIFRTEKGGITVGNRAVKSGLAHSMSIPLKRFEAILATALEVGCFDKHAYESENVLTSNGVQRRLSKVAHEREQERIRKDKYINKKKDKEKRKRKTTAGKQPENPLENSLLIETKQKFLRYVYLFPKEYDALLEKLNGKRDSYIERLDTYIGQIGEKAAAKKYVSHFDTILNWKRKDDEKNRERGSEYI
jgi:hypothetical protein